MRRGKVKLTLACAGMLTVSSIAVTSCAPSAEPEQYRDCEVCPLMVTVPPGNFVMGGPEGGAYPKNAYPRHEVTIGYALGVARYETGLTEYAACAAEGKCSQAPLKKTLEFLQLRGVREMSNYPVSFVRWKDAVAYTEWLSARTGKSYRLPSESEWEYVARAGSETLYWWGNKAHLKDRASCLTCLSRERPGIRERGSFEPNRFGLFDTAGNLGERVLDCLHDDYAGAPSSGKPWYENGNCERRGERGGTWYLPDVFARSHMRSWTADEQNRARGAGFRVISEEPE